MSKCDIFCVCFYYFRDVSVFCTCKVVSIQVKQQNCERI